MYTQTTAVYIISVRFHFSLPLHARHQFIVRALFPPIRLISRRIQSFHARFQTGTWRGKRLPPVAKKPHNTLSIDSLYFFPFSFFSFLFFFFFFFLLHFYTLHLCLVTSRTLFVRLCALEATELAVNGFSKASEPNSRGEPLSPSRTFPWESCYAGI